ncbi:MAG: HD-GYP domain-containing protein [Pseudomonadota bacterium]
MLKKISIKQLKMGMFIEKLDGNWLKHPFWKTSFKLDLAKNLKTLQTSEITHVWIDTSKGLDIVANKATKAPVEEVKAPKPKETKTTLQEEMKAAKETLDKAKQATMEMFQEARMGNSITMADVAPLVDEISESVTRNPAAMLSITRIKNIDDYTYLHSVAVCALMVALGKQINYKGNFHSLGLAGLLHDVGKMSIPEAILNKPGKLTDEEFKIIKSHPLRGWEILKKADDADEMALDVCLHHHEKVNGSGYPENLTAEKISLEAKMGAVCDVYDAITSNRCYKKGWDPADSLKQMASWKGEHFDDDIFKAFVKTIGIYPTGTILKLKSGRLGIVTEQSEKTLLQPKLKIFFSSSSNSPIPPKMIDLTRSPEIIESIEDPETWGFDRQKILDIISSK